MRCDKAIDFGIERMFFISLFIADRYVNDNFFSIKKWATDTELSPQEINFMQVKILNSLSYDLYVNGNEYLEWINQLVEYIKSEERHAGPQKYLKSIMADIENQKSSILMKIRTQVQFVILPSGIIRRYTPEIRLPSGIAYRYSLEGLIQ